MTKTLTLQTGRGDVELQPSKAYPLSPRREAQAGRLQLRINSEKQWPRGRFLSLQIVRGNGAGYIGGWTAFLVLNGRTRQPAATYGKQTRRFQIGFSRNAQRVPFPFT